MGLEITATTNCFKVDFKDIVPPTKQKKGIWNKSKITFGLYETSIKVIVDGQPSWDVSDDGNNGTVPIAKVDGVAPVSLADLYSKLETCLG